MAFAVRYPPLEKRFETRSEAAADPRLVETRSLNHGDVHSEVSGLRPLRVSAPPGFEGVESARSRLAQSPDIALRQLAENAGWIPGI